MQQAACNRFIANINNIHNKTNESYVTHITNLPSVPIKVFLKKSKKSNLGHKDDFGFGLAKATPTIITDESKTCNAGWANLPMATWSICNPLKCLRTNNTCIIHCLFFPGIHQNIKDDTLSTKRYSKSYRTIEHSLGESLVNYTLSLQNFKILSSSSLFTTF